MPNIPPENKRKREIANAKGTFRLNFIDSLTRLNESTQCIKQIKKIFEIDDKGRRRIQIEANRIRNWAHQARQSALGLLRRA
jgi:hypothetical protein